MSNAVTLDTREFDAALIQYAAASGKDLADISNKRVYDTALRSVKHMKKADVSAIIALKGQDKFLWWLAWRYYIPKGMSKSEAFEAAKQVIQIRRRAISFAKSFFLKMADKMAPYVGREVRSIKGGKGSYAGFGSFVSPATKERPVADVGITYDYAKRSDKTARGIEKLLMRALHGGMREATADMMQYVDRKMGITAKRYSARGVA